MKFVRVNLKTGLPTSPGDPKAAMEPFKPSQMPAGVVDEGEGEIGDQAMQDDYQGAAGEPVAGPIAAPPPPAPPPGPFGVPGSDRALTSGTGGLY